MAKWEQFIAARERKHLSQVEAAEQLNVGVVTYQRWEAGKRKPQPQYMRRLCDQFGPLSLEQESNSAPKLEAAFLQTQARSLPRPVRVRCSVRCSRRI